ncbi:MAG: two-component system response regulator [Bacteroidetes bacterium CG2_30_33_31]|nr:MAG: two-component system response regulator [Bacteroidetes bacterium CG2_30_33_31]
MKTKILLAEDDLNLGKILKSYLEAKDFNVDLYLNGEEALLGFQKNEYNIIVLDVMMPVMDGFTAAQNIRKTDKKIPIIFLTARSLEDDKLKGFDVGGDDYITKPFSMELLLARINAILRRLEHSAEDGFIKDVFDIGKYHFDFMHQDLIINKKSQKLTSKESELLKLLCQHENETLDRRIALNRIWKDDSYYNARSMDVYITKLRKYLKEDSNIQIINVHGIGFKLLTK